MPNPIGSTKTVGWQLGIRKTIQTNQPPEIIWQLLTNEEGQTHWNQDNITTTHKPRTHKPNNHLRTPWKMPQWTNTSTLQIRVLQAKTGITIAIHQEKLQDQEQRTQMLHHWEAVLEKITRYLQDNL